MSNKELRKKLIESDEKRKQEMRDWWDRILPRKGSLLRQLIIKEIKNK